MRLFFTLIMIVSFHVSADAPCDDKCQKRIELINAAAETSFVNKIWIKPETLTNQCKGYPYFPKGGIKSAYCFIKTYIPISVAETISGHKMFLFSPHNNDSIVRTNESFGHYNPEFLKWGIKNILPITENEDVKKTVEGTYQRYFSYSAKTYYLVWLQLQEITDENQKIKHEIKSAIQSKQYYGTDKYYAFLKEEYYKHPNLTWSGNIAKTAVPFWVRREIDGTSDFFIQALEVVFNTYDPDFMMFVSQKSHNKSLQRNANASVE